MALTVNHAYVSPIADDPASASANEILPSHWNANLTVTGFGALVATVDFGSTFTDEASVVVTGQSWVTATSSIIPQVVAGASDDPDEMYLLDFRPVISARVNGVGFTITLYTETEAKGTYDVMCIGS